MNLFFNTLQIVCALLLPVFLIIVLVVLAQLNNERVAEKKYRLEKAVKEPPYDKIYFQKVPNPLMLELVALKDGKQIFEHSFYTSEIEDLL